MDAWVWVVIAVVAVAVVVGLVLMIRSQRKRRRLRQQFGPEYERTVDRVGDRRSAEADLQGRARERDRLEIRPLSGASRVRYAEEWRRIQTNFVDEPDSAVGEADQLLSQVMTERGYPVEDFEAQAALVSVDHPHVVENYRAAHGVYVRNREHQADTDDLRRALLHYRSLFDELLVSEGGADGRGNSRSK